MSRRQGVIDEILARRVSAIIRTRDQQLAADAMRAAVGGGFKIVEFTLTTPGALELVAAFSKRDLLVGAGTVLNREQARQATQAGARFLVSPICDPEIIAEARALDVVAIPGTFTATEMETAHRAGADFCKLFPAPADVPGYIRSILGPLPHLRIFPTNGVALDNLHQTLAAGAAGVGFVNALFAAEWLEARDFDAIRRRAAELISRAASV
jgi:Entner-Doudoroff aldolase